MQVSRSGKSVDSSLSKGAELQAFVISERTKPEWESVFRAKEANTNVMKALCNNYLQHFQLKTALSSLCS